MLLWTASAGSGSSTLLHSLGKLWPLWLAVGLILAARAAAFAWREHRLRRSGIFEIDRMNGPTFERRLALLFRKLGYKVEHIGRAGGDFGGDLLLVKDGTRSVVQAKCWAKNVGVKAVQEAVAARGFYKAERAMVVGNRGFSAQARSLALANEVELWDREKLVRTLLQTAKTKPEPASSEEESSTSFCARCGKPVSERVRDYCLAHPKRFTGLVYCYDHQRAL